MWFYRDLKAGGLHCRTGRFFFGGNPYRPEQDSFFNGRYGWMFVIKQLVVANEMPLGRETNIKKDKQRQRKSI